MSFVAGCYSQAEIVWISHTAIHAKQGDLDMLISKRSEFQNVVLWSVLVLGAGIGLINVPSFAQRQVRNQNGVLQNQNRVLASGQGVVDQPGAFRNVAQQVFRSIVAIEAFGRGSGSCRGPGPFHRRGSGFVIAPGDGIITSNSLVGGADRVRIRLSDGTSYLASSVAVDPLTDIAVLRFSPALNVPALPLADSNAMAIGDWVLAVGNRPTRDVLFNEQVAAGVISSRGPGPGIARREDFLQTDIPFDAVSPGAPLLNLNGEVVGIHTALGAASDSPPRGGVVVPSNLLNRVSRQLIDNGVVNRAYLGVSTQPVDPQMARQLNLPANTGALVNQVLPGSPAAAANLQVGDVVQGVNGVVVADGHQLQTLADDLPVGQKVPVDVVRGGRAMTLNVVPAAMPPGVLPAPVGPRSLNPALPGPITSFPDLGAEVGPLTPATTPSWAKGPATQGVVVTSVAPGSPAADAGLRPGVIIEKVGDSAITAPADIATANANWANPAGVLLLVRSPRGPRFLIVGGNPQ